METWLKMLIGTACVFVIAAGSLYGWREYTDYRERAAIAQTRKDVERALFRMVGAAPDEVDRVRSFCSQVRWLNEARRDEERSKIITACRFVGYLS